MVGLCVVYLLLYIFTRTEETQTWCPSLQARVRFVRWHPEVRLIIGVIIIQHILRKRVSSFRRKISEGTLRTVVVTVCVIQGIKLNDCSCCSHLRATGVGNVFAAFVILCCFVGIFDNTSDDPCKCVTCVCSSSVDLVLSRLVDPSQSFAAMF